MQKKDITLVWFRNDLRLHDNEVINHAVKTGLPIVCIYSLEPRFFQSSVLDFPKLGSHRLNFLLQALKELKSNLDKFNIPLIVSKLSPDICLEKLNLEFKVRYLFYQKDWTTEEYSVEQKVSVAAQNYKIQHQSFYNQFLFNPDEVSNLFTVFPDSFSSFRKKVEKKAIVPVRSMYTIPKQSVLTVTSLDIFTLDLKPVICNLNSAFPFKGGEQQGILRLNDYVFETKKVGFYKKTRNGLLGKDYSSKFSSWLAIGCLSPRLIYWTIKEFESKHYANQSTYWLVFELLWREFFKFSSIKHGTHFFHIEGIQKKPVDLNSDLGVFKKWINGNTSDDFVNANMIELKSTGWMSNRGRQNVASYLVHNLNLDWRLGAAYFESMLLDYDVHSNYGNWMYVAGVGSNKIVKVFDTKKQAEWYDPAKKFQKLWLQPTLF